MSRLLLIDDDTRLTDMVGSYLRANGFEVDTAASLALGRQRLHTGAYDALVLDLMLPDGDGLDYTRELRSEPRTRRLPLLMLTARGEPTDRIVGLEIGADDYVVKPFSPREISARVRAILRRSQGRVVIQPSMAVGAAPEALFEHDPQRKRIRYRGHWLDLTRYEYLVLSALLRHPEHVLSREQLMDSAWDDPSANFDRVVDTHIKGIRAKLKRIDPAHDPIVTHRGLGYSLDMGIGQART